MRDLPSQEVDLTYITSRGNWYLRSWKGDMKKSGGVATNIGIHFFDMLLWLFGEVRDLEVHRHDDYSCAGIVTSTGPGCVGSLALMKITCLRRQGERPKNLPQHHHPGRRNRVQRRVTDLHTVSYQKILGGEGFSAQDARSSIDLAYRIRNTQPRQAGALSHPFLNILNNRRYMNFVKDLEEKKSAISVIGLGYVGLPIALEFARMFRVIGFDIRPDRWPC
jgi:UDP-N-acetyl-2-amino-2-deoxyglucuronate dehydrogenase